MVRRTASLSRRTFFFKEPATTEIYTLSLHDALPIYRDGALVDEPRTAVDLDDAVPLHLRALVGDVGGDHALDRKSTRLNSSHGYISYAVFCLKKKKKVIVAGEAILLHGRFIRIDTHQ